MRKILRKILCGFAICLASAVAYGVPAFPLVTTVEQSDGTRLEITFAGDEHLAYHVTDDGVPVVRNESGDWCYARAVSEGLASSDILAHGAELRGEAENEAVLKLRMEMAARRFRSPKAHGPAKREVPRRTDLTGSRRGLVILCEFTDVKFAVDNPSETFQQVLNGTDYKENGFYGSLRDYFRDQSNGQFDFQFDVVGPVTLPQPMKYYGEDKEGIIDYNGPDLAVHACKIIDDRVNFADYDWDGDEEIDMLFIVYAGYGQNYGASSDTVWPFKGYASHSGYQPDREFTFLDGIFIDVFACSCELYGTSGTMLNGIGTMAHEFSHCFGLKDHYGTGGTGHHPMGYWDLMDFGSYNDCARRPVGYTAYERFYCGWSDPIELTSGATVSEMLPLGEGGKSYVIYNDGNRDECFFLENRYRRGWDEFLPNYGVLITHLDYFDISWRNNTVNTIQLHPRYGVVPADNKSGMGDEDQKGDPYPYLNSIQGSFNDFFTDVSSPASVLFNDNLDGTKRLGKPVTNIDVRSGGIASFDFMGGGPEPSETVLPAASDNTVYDVYTCQGVNLGRYGTPEAARKAGHGVLIIRNSEGKTVKHISM